MIIAIDFDGTITDHRYPDLGRPVPGAFEWMKRFQAAGATLILWTMRSDGPDGPLLTEADDFCRENGVIFKHVNENPQAWTTSPKVLAHAYIDDSAIGCPLKENPRMCGRPIVDWDIVGPLVMAMIENDGDHRLRTPKANTTAWDPYGPEAQRLARNYRLMSAAVGGYQPLASDVEMDMPTSNDTIDGT